MAAEVSALSVARASSRLVGDILYGFAGAFDVPACAFHGVAATEKDDATHDEQRDAKQSSVTFHGGVPSGYRVSAILHRHG
jgi:hypothetical protein